MSLVSKILWDVLSCSAIYRFRNFLDLYLGEECRLAIVVVLSNYTAVRFDGSFLFLSLSLVEI